MLTWQIDQKVNGCGTHLCATQLGILIDVFMLCDMFCCNCYLN